MKTYVALLSATLLVFTCKSYNNNTNTQTQSNTKITNGLNPQPYAKTITANELKTALYKYASDEFQGRETGEPGQKLAVNFIKSHYEKMGVPAAKPDGNYFQKVALEIYKVPEATLKLNGVTFSHLNDFVSISKSSPSGILQANNIVHAGFGIEDKNYSDYKSIDVKNKVIYISEGEPKTSDGTYKITGTKNKSQWSTLNEEHQLKLNLAKSKGAKAVLFYTPTLFNTAVRTFGKPGHRMTIIESSSPNYFFIINKKIAEILDHLKFNTKHESALNFNLNYKNTSKPIDTENVAAFIKGSEKPNEIIVISAHLDHEGVKKGKVYNGADDDGSGTVAVLEIAQAFAKAKKDGLGPKRSILFLNVTGEERGLLGSQYYTDVDPIFPLKNTIANLNIDMIGRTDPKREKRNRNYVYLIGSDKLSTDLHNISEAVNSKYMNIDLDYTFNAENDPNRFYYRSDHYNFAKNNIPVIFYFNGTHADYHKPTDTPDKIQYDLLENRARLIFYTAWELANRNDKIVVDKAVK